MSEPGDKTAAAIIDEAAGWHAALRQSSVSAATRRDFAEWLLESPRHGLEYLRATEIWEDLRHLDTQNRLDIDALVAAGTTAKVVPLYSHSRGSMPDGGRSSRAAVVAAALGLLGMFLGLTGDVASAPYDAFVTAFGEQRSFPLDGGTLVYLNTDSSVRVDAARSPRRLEIRRGEALIDMTAADHDTVSIRVREIHVSAAGARINVKLDDRTTAFTVAEGRAVLSKPASAGKALLELRPGYTAHCETTCNIVTRTADIASDTAWVWRQIIADEEPLVDLVAEFNRYSEQKLRLAADAPPLLPVSGQFAVDDPRPLIDALERNAGIEALHRPDGSIWLTLRFVSARAH